MQVLVAVISKHMKEKGTENGQHGFMKGKLCLTNVITFYREVIG